MVMWHVDPDFARIIADERWERRREAAEQGRLVRGPAAPGVLSAAARLAKRLLEHTYYNFSPGRFSVTPEEDDVPALTDAEIARLLALLSGGPEHLLVERVPRRDDPDEETCSPAPCRERAS